MNIHWIFSLEVFGFVRALSFCAYYVPVTCILCTNGVLRKLFGTVRVANVQPPIPLLFLLTGLKDIARKWLTHYIRNTNALGFTASLEQDGSRSGSNWNDIGKFAGSVECCGSVDCCDSH